MKVVLVRPFSKNMYTFMPPLGLGYLASTLKRGGHAVLLYEAARDRRSSPAHFEEYLRTHNPDMVGVQLYSVDLDVTRQYLELSRKVNPRIFTVAGGPHPSALPEETMLFYGQQLLDFVIAGEAEYGLLQLANALAQGSRVFDDIAGLVWFDEKKVLRKNARQTIENLDELPWPDWELLDPRAYPDAPLGGFVKGFPVAYISISRGCPMHCTFCGSRCIYGDGYRVRGIDSVIAEIRHLIERFGIREISVQDDNILFRRQLFMEFCAKIKPLRVDWSCINGIRLDCVDEEIVRMMKEAGCYAVGVGIESGSQKILNDMRKGLTLPLIREKTDLLARHGIFVLGLFIIGYPTETREDILKTIAFAKSLKLDKAMFAGFLPVPGSDIFNELRSSGRLTDSNLSEMSYFRVTESYTPHVPSRELEALLKKAILSFYLRPAVFLRMLIRAGSLPNLFNIARRFIKNYLFSS